MTVTAIRCEACRTCEGVGLVEKLDWWGRNVFPEVIACPLCSGTGIERPPQDHDTRARQAIEKTETDDDEAR